jgi:hypothetical protein
MNGLAWVRRMRSDDPDAGSVTVFVAVTVLGLLVLSSAPRNTLTALRSRPHGPPVRRSTPRPSSRARSPWIDWPPCGPPRSTSRQAV